MKRKTIAGWKLEIPGRDTQCGACGWDTDSDDEMLYSDSLGDWACSAECARYLERQHEYLATHQYPAGE